MVYHSYQCFTIIFHLLQVYSSDMPNLTNVTILGVSNKPSTVTVNQNTIKTFSYDQTQTLSISFSVSMKVPLKITWR